MNNSTKIISDLENFLSSFDRINKTIVFTNGCFDLLHEGHLYLLKEAKKSGDILIVAVNSDASVKKLKGNSRPIQTLQTRLKKLSDLPEVDYVISFAEETPLQLIEKIKPNIIVKGGDYSPDNVIGKEYAQHVVIIPLLEGFSTTKIIQTKK